MPGNLSRSPSIEVENSLREDVLYEERIEWIRVIHGEIFKVMDKGYLRSYRPYRKITSHWTGICQRKVALERVENLLRDQATCDAIKVRQQYRSERPRLSANMLIVSDIARTAWYSKSYGRGCARCSRSTTRRSRSHQQSAQKAEVRIVGIIQSQTREEREGEGSHGLLSNTRDTNA